jgi:plastocyanin
MTRVLVLLAATAVLVLGLAVGQASGGSGTTVKSSNFKFAPKTVTIKKGGKVTWQNVNGTHTVTFKNGSFDKTISGHQSVSKRFKRSGTFRYVCTLHIRQGMKGKVVVK